MSTPETPPDAVDDSVPGDAPADVEAPTTDAVSTDSATTDPVVVTADPPPAVTQVLDQAATPDPQVDVTTRAQVSAQSVVDQGTPTPVTVDDGAPVAPVETVDSHTVDASGTADDTAVVAAPVADDVTVVSDITTPPVSGEATAGDAPQIADLVNPGPAPVVGDAVADVPSDAEVSAKFVLREIAILGLHHSVVSQWVDEVWAGLQGERNTAASAQLDDPYPLLAS